MKKVMLSFLVCLLLVFTFALPACGKSEGGTYYPTLNEMKANLENKGYLIEFAVGERNNEGTGYVVDSLSATKDGDFIYFYWIENSTHCKVYYDKLQELHPNAEHFVSIENDEQFGNIVYCGTSAAVDDAGIRVVKVKV